MKVVADRDRKDERFAAFCRQEGALVVTVMVFCAVFLTLGTGLYFLISSQTRATETERTDIKAFNVTEAGVDAGMLALKLDWPEKSGQNVVVDAASLKSTLQTANPGLWDPSRSDPTEFLQVAIYDNVDSVTGNTTDVADPNAPSWDSNGDGRMFVEASGNVDDDRHRILILAERQNWTLDFPAELALWASAVDSNGQGLQVSIEDPHPVPDNFYVNYDVHDVLNKKINEGYHVDPLPSSTTFSQVVSEAVRNALEGIARGMGTYFEGPDADDDASDFLKTPAADGQPGGAARGKVVYVKADSAVTIAGNIQIGTEDEPTVIILDTPDGSDNKWDMKGTADFYGIVITIGDSILRGTCGIHGAMYCAGILTNKGTGASGEINYNSKCITNINGQYLISVNIVPNTWEEYTLPKTTTSVTAP